MTMERILYFSGYRMTVFDWDGKLLIGSRDFQPDEEGFDDFEELLEGSVRVPTRLLVDMIEEDFRREVIPHVNRFDISTLIQRQLDRHYRDEDYVHAKVIGRSDVGRRDDRLLLSALTNTGLLAPWLDRLATYNVRLAGIWSLPLLTEKLLRPILKDDKNALIVSRQVRSALRNSYFQDGKLLLSRQAKFDKDMWDRDDFEGVMTNLERGALEIHNFLINQRIMSNQDHLKVYCILDEAHIENARSLSHDAERVHYSFVSLESLFKHFGIQGGEEHGAAALFSYLCTHVNPLTDHYATRKQKSTYYQYLVNRFITQVAETGSLICITAAVVLALRSMDLGQEQVLVTRDTAHMSELYAKEYGEIETQLSTASMVQDTVTLFSQIDKDALQAPQKYFAPLGDILGQPDFANLHLKELDWKKHTATEIRQIVLSERLQQQDQNNSSAQEALFNEYQFDSEEEELRVQAALTIKGEIDTNGRAYRSTIRSMQQFVQQLQKIEGVQTVLLIRTAVDVRDSARFTDQIGGPDTGERDSNAFEILVVFAGTGGIGNA